MCLYSVLVLLLALFNFRIAAGCGGTYTASSGEITSPNYPGTYYASYICTYDISTPPTSVILLTFQDFQLEGCCDYLEIYDGDSMNAFKLGQFNAAILPPQIHSSQNHLYLRFRTDGSGQYRGFRIHYTSLLPVPQNISVTAISSTALRVYWHPPNTTIFNVVNYTVTLWPLTRQHTPTPGCPALPPLHANIAVVVNGSTVEANVHYLLPDVNFRVTVTATTAGGQGPPSVPITAITLPTASEPVRDLTVEVKDKLDNTTFSWRAPCDSGGVLGHFLVLLESASLDLPVKNHTLDRAIIQPMEESYSTTIATSSLTAETQYRVTVVPVGPHGLYGANRTTTFHVPARVPTEPQNVSVTALSSSAVRVHWQPPVQTHGTLRNYTITLQPLTRHHSPAPGCPAAPPLHSTLATLSGTTLNADVHYLLADVEFKVTVSAATSAGSGPVSAPVIITTLPAASGPVEDLTVELVGEGVGDLTTISWKAPCESGGVLSLFLVVLECANGNLPCATYTLKRMSQPLEETYSASVPTSSLTCETQYKVTVCPVGHQSLYGANRTASFQVPARVPTQPQNVSVTALSSSAVRVHWQSPTQSHGTIHNYTLTLQPLARHHSPALGCPAAPPFNMTVVTVNGSTLEVDVHYLLDDVEYEVTVKAATAAGPGQTSIPTTALTLPAASGPVRNLTVEVENSNATRVSWRVPCDSGGFLIHFLVELEVEDHQEPRSNSDNHTCYVHLIQPLEESYSVTVSTSSLAAGERYRVTVTPVGTGGLLGRNVITNFRVPAKVAASEHWLFAEGRGTLWLSLLVVGAAAVVLVVCQANKRKKDKKRKKEKISSRHEQAVAAGDLGLDDLLQCD